MVVNKEILTDYKKIYENALQLIEEEEEEEDPQNEPYRSYYAARDVLQQMKEMLKNSLASLLAKETDNEREDSTYKVILALVCRSLARIYYFTGESSVAEQQLQECIELMEEHRMLPESISLYVGTLNEMGIVYANRDNHHKAHEMLVRAEHAYHEFKQAAAGDAKAIMDIFGTADEDELVGPVHFESLYPRITFSLSQVLKHLGQLDKSAEYCHLTLRRQLELNRFEPIDFAWSTAALSPHFIRRNMFKEARHNLATAQHIMTQHEAKMLASDLSEQQRSDITETYKHRYADVARCWAMYGVMLLEMSWNRLEDSEKLAADVKAVCMDPLLDPLAYLSPDMDVSSIEKRASADYCQGFNDAKRVYRFVTNCLDRAKEYYKPEMEDVTEYADIIIDFGLLYKNFAFFKNDLLSQAQMHKRSAKYYEEVLDLLNPVVHMGLCRECWLRCGMEYYSISQMLDATNEEALNQVCQKAIKLLLQFVNSCMEEEGLRFKSDISVEEQENTLLTFYYLGNLYLSMYLPNASVELENIKIGLKYYKRFIMKCAERKEVLCPVKLNFCRDMVKTLTIDIAEMEKRLGN